MQEAFVSGNLLLEAVRKLRFSARPPVVVCRYLCLLLVMLAGIGGLRLVVQSVLPEFVYRKDFLQEYLLAKAVTSGASPYLPISTLAERFLGPLPTRVFWHPTPHPPPVAILSLPLALLSYERAAQAWLAFELLCVLLAVRMALAECMGRRAPLYIALLGLAAFLGWDALWQELVLGQLETLLLLLMVCAWRSFRSQRAWSLGLCLGLILALKLMAWPIVGYLVLRRNWRAAGGAAATFIAANLLACLVMGWGTVAAYYGKVSASVLPLYESCESNFSVWSLGPRLFVGTGSAILPSVVAAPLVYAPLAARLTSFILVAYLAGGTLLLALRTRSIDVAFSLLVCASVLGNPIAWHHYLILLLVPLAVLAMRLYRMGLPPRPVAAAIGIGVLLMLPRDRLHQLVVSLGQIGPIADPATVSLPASLLSLLPCLATIGLLALIWSLRTSGGRPHSTTGHDDANSWRL